MEVIWRILGKIVNNFVKMWAQSWKNFWIIFARILEKMLWALPTPPSIHAQLNHNTSLHPESTKPTSKLLCKIYYETNN